MEIEKIGIEPAAGGLKRLTALAERSKELAAARVMPGIEDAAKVEA